MTKAYSVITVNNNGQPFPDTRAIDASGPLAVDGTEIIKEVVDDIWLESQALLDFYNNPPNGLDDLPGVDAITGLPNSQPLATQYMAHATPGVIVNWPSEEDPFVVGLTHGIDIRLLLLEGQGIDRTLDDYKMLDSIVYIGDTDNPTADSFYHANDAGGINRNPAGIYLILPDARGYSWRALDPSGTIDPDGASRIMGSFQEDALQNIFGIFFSLQKNLFEPRIIRTNNFLFSFNPIYTLSPFQDQIQSTTATGGLKPQDQIEFDTSKVLGLKTALEESRSKNITTNFAISY